MAVMTVAKKGDNVLDKVYAAAAEWYENELRGNGLSRPLQPNPWGAHLTPVAAEALPGPSGSKGSKGCSHVVIDFDQEGGPIDARRTILAAQTIEGGTLVVRKSTGKTFMVQKVTDEGVVSLAGVGPDKALGALFDCSYDSFRTHYEVADKATAVWRLWEDVNIFDDPTLDQEFWRTWVFQTMYSYVEDLYKSVTAVRIQVEPRRAVFADAKFLKDRLLLPLLSTRVQAFSGKIEYSFPNYARVELTDYQKMVICFLPGSFKGKFAPGWAVHPVSDAEEANCVIKMKPVPEEQGIRVPVIVNTKTIAKGTELKVFKKKVEKNEKPDKSTKRITDRVELASASAGSPRKAQKH